VVLTACHRSTSQGSGYGQDGALIVIKGTLEDGAGREVVLDEMTAREYIPLDTALCDNKGDFLISFMAKETAFYALRAGGNSYITLLIEPGDEISLSGIYGNSGNYSVEGSAGSELLMELSQEHKRTLDELAGIARRKMELITSPDFDGDTGELDNKFDSVSAAFRDYSLRFIHRNEESLAILIALYNLYGHGLPVFHPERDFGIYRYVDSVLSLNFGGFEMVELLHAQVAEAKAVLDATERRRGPGIGEIAPDFVSSRPDGQQLALRDLRGSYVLLSFWAGWSESSMEENRTLKEAWTRYGDKAFRILQVSFDSEKDTWIRAIGEEDLKWDHVSDLRQWDTPVAELYRVERIPSNYLIDPSGRIIAVDLFGNELLEYLEKLFGINESYEK
jgi:peroxiredoxin